MARQYSNTSPELALVGAINSTTTIIKVNKDPVATADFTLLLSPSPDKTTEELVLVTAVTPNGSDYDLTVVRGYDGTTAKTHASAARAFHVVGKEEFEKLRGVEADANNYAHPNHTGDVTSSGDGATTIANDAVTNAKLANMAASSIKGRASGSGTGDPVDLTPAEARAILNVEDGATADQTAAEIRTLVEAATDSNVFTDSEKTNLGNQSGTNTGDEPSASTTVQGIVELATTTETNAGTDTVRAVTPSSLNDVLANVSANNAKVSNATHTGDVTGSTALTIANNAVSNAKAADMAQSTIKGRATASTGDPEDLTAAQVRTIINVENGATADQTAAEIRSLVESATDSNVFTDDDHTKLNSVETGATADQSAGEIKTAYESNADTNAFTDADHSKLDGIEALADVTDATNVNAAGAVMNSDASTASMSFVVDEDNMASNSATKVPTQQSVKAYVDTLLASGVDWKGGYNASTNTPDLDVAPSGVGIGDMYAVTVAGTFFTAAVEVGDVLIANTVGADAEAEWTIVQANLNAGSIKTLYESNSDTNAFTNALLSKLNGIEASATADQTAAEIRALVESATDSNVFTDADHTKLNGIATSANNYTHPNHSGDVTSTGDGATTIAANAVTNAKAADMGQSTIKGRASGAGTGDPTDLTATQVRTIINVENGATADQTAGEIKTAYESNADTNAYTDTEKTKLGAISGTNTGDEPDASTTVKGIVELATLSEANAGTDSVRAVTPASLATILSNVSANNAKVSNATHTGDVTGSAALTIANNAVSNAKAADMAASTIKGRVTASTGDPEDLTAAQVRTIINVENGATADQNASEIKSLYESNSNTNAFTDADHSKLDAIEASATADQTAAEIRALVESATDSNVFTDADHSKLNAIEAGADVTDAANVDAAGAVMNTDTSTASMSFVLDEDAMTSNSATKVATQQSIKAYVDTRVSSSLNYKGGYNASTDSPSLDSSPIAVSIGDVYTVTTAGTFFTVTVEAGDMLIAEVDSASVEADWTIVQANLTAATIKSLYESNSNTNAYTDAEKSKLGAISGTNTGDEPSASTTVQGIVELATTTETNAGSDGTRAVTPASLTTVLSNVATNNAKVSNATHTGEVTGSTALTIASNAVTNAKLADMATARIKGRVTGSTGDPEDLTAAQVRTIINVESGATADQTAAEIRTLVESATDSNVFTDNDHSKLNGIEAGADVTDAANVNAAGAVMVSDTSTSGMGFVIDEDAMGSNSNTKVPTQQSTKAYADTKLPLAGGTLSGEVNHADNLVTRPRIKDYALTHNALGTKTSATTIDLTLGNYVSATIGAALTFTFSNPSASPHACGFVLRLTNGGNYAVTWPASVEWAGGTAPSLTENGVDILTFITEDGGTTWRGMLSIADPS